jgi:hypothetical protein
LWLVSLDNKTKFADAVIDDETKFSPGVREKYFPDFKPSAPE